MNILRQLRKKNDNLEYSTQILLKYYFKWLSMSFTIKLESLYSLKGNDKTLIMSR